MQYYLSVIITILIFFVLDVFIFIKAIQNNDGTTNQKLFVKFSLSVAAQQLFAVFTVLSNPEFNTLGKAFSYFSYISSLVLMTASSYLCYRYLKLTISAEEKSSKVVYWLCISPLILILVTSLASPITHWVFFIDEQGAYQRGSLFFLQMFCPYIYVFFTLGLGIIKRKHKDSVRLKTMIRFFLVFEIPSMLGVLIQMFVLKGCFSSIGISIGLFLLYLEIYMDEISENKRLKSVNVLNTQLQKVNDEQKKHIEEIALLNTELKQNHIQLEKSVSEQREQLIQISELNEQLNKRMSLIQSMSRVYFVSFYVDVVENNFTEISNTDFVKKYVGSNGTASQALDVFCDAMVEDEFSEKLRCFVDFSTLDDRLKNKEVITCDYLGKVAGWCQLYFIAGERNDDGTLKTVFLAARTIHDEKEREFAQNREIDNARIAAENANAAKTVFLNNMSHDIRTPLNAILGFSDLMAKEENNPEAVADYLQKIKQSGKYLLSIINNVLDMARIESGKVTIENSLTDLADEEKKIRVYVGQLVESSNHKFKMSFKVNHRYILLDFAKFQQIMMNLVSNAIKYTPAGGTVSLDIEEFPCDKKGFGTFVMTVTDTGIGMSPEFIEHIFDSFSRERNTTDSKIIGTGLGMSIVKKLVDLVSGTIRVESEKGKGSKFTVTCDLEFDDNPIVSEYHDENLIPDVSFEGKRVLLTEDNELNAEIATSLLNDAGFQVDHAENGVVCIDMLTKAPNGYYDLIFMDIQMPLLNGYETTRRIREAGYDIPIFAMTANAFEEDKRHAIESGMNGHLSKPLDIGKVMDTLYKLFA